MNERVNSHSIKDLIGKKRTEPVVVDKDTGVTRQVVLRTSLSTDVASSYEVAFIRDGKNIIPIYASGEQRHEEIIAAINQIVSREGGDTIALLTFERDFVMKGRSVVTIDKKHASITVDVLGPSFLFPELNTIADSTAKTVLFPQGGLLELIIRQENRIHKSIYQNQVRTSREVTQRKIIKNI